MLDKYIHPKIQSILAIPAKILISKGFTANQITITGFIIGMFAILTLTFQLYYISLFLILLNRLFDGLDGTMARLTNSSETGGFLDIVLDFIFYNWILIGFALARPENILPSLLLMACFTITGTSFLAFSIIATKHNFKKLSYFKNKAIYYSTGLAEGSETIVFLILACLLPYYFVYLAIIYGIMCLITGCSRIYNGYHLFKKIDNDV